LELESSIKTIACDVCCGIFNVLDVSIVWLCDGSFTPSNGDDSHV